MNVDYTRKLAVHQAILDECGLDEGTGSCQNPKPEGTFAKDDSIRKICTKEYGRKFVGSRGKI